MRVLKFGGTSVGRSETFKTALRRVLEETQETAPIVVVSALSGVTNALVEYAEKPGRRAALAETIVERHVALADEVGVSRASLQRPLDAWRAWVRETREVGTPLDPAGRDHTLSFGERLSAELLAAGLRAAGLKARGRLAGDVGLVTDDQFGSAHPVDDVDRRLRAGLGEPSAPLVVTGFLGRTEDGRITTLGRGGSDYTASLIGAAVGASEVQIWTDTNGLLSADPALVPHARPVPRLTFAEASELAYFGARVLHPKTLLPAIKHGIPVRVLNTLRPDDPGSLIAPVSELAGDARGTVKSIAYKKGITAVTIASTRMLLAFGFLARVFEVFGRHRVVVDLVTTSEVTISVTVDDTSRLAAALAELEGIGEVSVREGLAVVAVVGEGAPRRIGLAGRVFDMLGNDGVGIEMISQGASRVNLSFVVREEDAERSVRLLHDGLLMKEAAATAAQA